MVESQRGRTVEEKEELMKNEQKMEWTTETPKNATQAQSANGRWS
jgi:hypothetical protein